MKKTGVLIAILCMLFHSCSLDPSDKYARIQIIEPSAGGGNQENSRPFTYTGITYAGMLTPMENGHFTADAFFMLKGNVQCAEPSYQYSYVTVTRVGSDDIIEYWVRGDFLERIWLRFGAGEYTVRIYKMIVDEPNLDYEGDILKWKYFTPPAYTFSVTNTRDENGSFIYPSDPIQSDDPELMSLASEIVKDAVPGTTENKTRLIHDWVAKLLYYDTASLAPGQRQKQDALTTHANGFAICEGYTSLMNALLRASGIQVKCVLGYVGSRDAKHAWSHVYDKEDLSWYYCDVTWDDWIDPETSSNDDPEGNNIIHTYFYSACPLPNHIIENERPGRSFTGITPDSQGWTWTGCPAGV